MSIRSCLVVVLLGVLSACGGVEKKACSATRPCGLNETCQLPAGTCVSLFGSGGGAGGSTGGGSASACSPQCSGTTPRCLSAGGVSQCVQCLGVSDCSDGMGCNLATHACELNNAAGGGSGGDGGGAAGSGGGTSGTGGGSSGTGGGSSGTGGGSTGGGAGGGWAGTGGGYAVYDAGSGPPFTGRGSCAPQDAGTVACSPGCTDGFSCLNGVCTLNGASGPVQVTLRWNSQEDLDLHVDEPLPNGTTCEIYYSDPNSDPTDPSTCGARGSLDLDSEAGCSADYVDIENVIYPAGGSAPRGQYTVRVDHYANCDPALTLVPFEVEARFNGMSVGLCGYFSSSDPDWDDSGSSGAGRQVMTFFVP